MQVKRRVIRTRGLLDSPPENTKPLALVADADWITREVVSAILERQGFQCLRAKTGFEARTLLYRHHPELMVLDLHMPLGGGLEVLATLKHSPLQRPVKTMILSADQNPEDIQEAAALGAGGFMAKPLVTMEFIARVREMVPVTS